MQQTVLKFPINIIYLLLLSNAKGLRNLVQGD